MLSGFQVLILPFIFFSSLFCSFTFSFSQPRNNQGEIFPIPETLKPNVEFWKKVYAEYSERQVIIHDARNLQIIYEVVHLDSLFRGVSVSSRIEWKRIEQIKKSYVHTLKRLSRKRNIDLNKLHGREHYVATLFGPKVKSKQLRAASKRVRAQSGLKERFRKGLERSGIYLSRMKQIFHQEGLPLELLALPHVESSFNYRAYSKFGAAGLWQFTRSTGRVYMKVNYNIDQRLDPIIATRSAAKLLKENYRVLGSWPLAITAYNHGRNGMRRAKRKFGADISKIVFYYRSRSFGFASRNFYTEFLAALEISSHYRQYFDDIQLQQPREYVEFQLPHYITVKTLIKKLGLTRADIAEFNPSLRRPVLNSRRRIPKNVTINVPIREGFDLEKLYARISPNLKFNNQVKAAWHKVRRGENMSQIARRYRVSLTNLMTANNIRNAHRIYVGQNLQIPGRAGVTISARHTATVQPKETRLADATDVTAKQQRSVFDIPREISFGSTKNSNRVAATDTSPAITYIPPKPWRDTSLQTAWVQPLRKRDVVYEQQQHISVEEVMEMALPDYHVELSRNMDIRVVKNPKVEAVHEIYRDIEMPENGQVIVEPDETLGHFADWLDVPTYKLRRINRLAYGTPIRMGRPLWLTFENVTPEEFHRQRVEYHQGIEEDFYRNFSVQGENTYKIKRGDNVWVLCNRRFEMPPWLLKKYNPDIKLVELQAGQELVVPVVEARYPQDVISN